MGGMAGPSRAKRRSEHPPALRVRQRAGAAEAPARTLCRSSSSPIHCVYIYIYMYIRGRSGSGDGDDEDDESGPPFWTPATPCFTTYVARPRARRRTPESNAVVVVLLPLLPGGSRKPLKAFGGPRRPSRPSRKPPEGLRRPSSEARGILSEVWYGFRGPPNAFQKPPMASEGPSKAFDDPPHSDRRPAPRKPSEDPCGGPSKALL